MGCDIHICVEKKMDGEWLLVTRVPIEADVRDRHYKRFAALAGVRGDGPEPKGIPADISKSAKLFIDEWDADGHSHSWETMRDALKIWNDPKNEYPGQTSKEFDAWEFGEIEEENIDDYRIIFFFDN